MPKLRQTSQRADVGQFDFCLSQQAEVFELHGSVARMDSVSMRPTPPNECMKTSFIIHSNKQGQDAQSVMCSGAASRRFAGNPPQAKIVSARRHHS